MSSVKDLNNKSDKKEIISTKDISSQNIIKSNDSKISEPEQEKNNSSLILPPLNTSFRKKALQEPTSILTKFIQQQTSALIKQTNKDTILFRTKSKPLKYIFSSDEGSKNIKIIKDKMINNNYPNIKLESIPQSVLITEKNILSNNNNTNNNNISIINKSKEKESFIKEKEMNEIIPTKSFPSSNKLSNPLTTNNEIIPSDENINENNLFYNKFRRLCNFFPDINKSSKKYGLKKKLNHSVENLHCIYYSDVNFQSKIFGEQINLIEESITQYKICVNKNNYLEVFKSLSLSLKINYNKTLEKTCGLLLSLPKMILGDYEYLMHGIKEISFPKDVEFQSSYIFDEVENVIKNNKKLSDIFKFLKQTYEFYLILSKKIDSEDLALNHNDYINILSYFAKIRDNLFYVINSFHNAEKNYVEDLSTIKKICDRRRFNIRKDKEDDILEEGVDNNSSYDRNKKGENKKKEEKEKVVSKFAERMKKQFFFKRNEEAQKLNRINSALGLDDKDSKIYNYLGKEINKKNKKKYKSIFENKLFDKLLNYYDDNTRIQIISNKINEEEKKYKKKKFKVIKINF